MTQDVDDKWTCVRHRCELHYDVPAQNLNEAHGSECGGCIAAARDSWKERALKAEKDTHRLDWLDSTQFPDDIGMGEQLKWQIGPHEADNLRDAIDGAMKEWFEVGEPDNT
jgi:hypothetical protein